jgi:hypothetical protein
MSMLRMLLVVAAVVVVSSCKDREDPPRGPVTEKNTKPWNVPEPGRGGGAFNVMPQQPRR